MARKKKGTSLFRRLMYLVVVVISGGGAGGYAFQDHPVIKSLLSAITGAPTEGAGPGLDGSLVTNVVDALKPADKFGQPGLYQVAIARVELDQKLFRPGHTIDIQARVRKVNSAGRETTVWDAKNYGSRLATVGKDDLTAGWPDRPFQVAWNAGDHFVLEVYDASLELFIQRKRFTLAQADPSVSVFPLKSGDFPLQSVASADAPVNPRANHVVLQSERLGDLRSSNEAPTQVADRPIVIR